MGLIPHGARTGIRLHYHLMKTNHITLVHHLVVMCLVTVLLAIAGVGCNTAHGFGKDVENAGDSIQSGTK